MKLLEPIVPTWRFIFWGIIAAVAVGTLGWMQGERSLLISIVAPVVGAIIGAFGFFLQWSRTHPWVLRPLLWLVPLSFLVWLTVEVILVIRGVRP